MLETIAFPIHSVTGDTMKTTTRIPRCHHREPGPPRTELLTTAELIERVGGAGFRRIDYWTRQGWLQPHVRARGSGSRRLYHESEIPVAAALTVLSEATAPATIGDVYERVALAARSGETCVTVRDLFISWRLS
jgi:hypothetical protein